MTSLPTDFQFSQGSLQDYVDCPRRFELKYLLRLAWPAEEIEPAVENEQYLRRGAAFHRLAHQHALGIAPEQLARALADEHLSKWWQNYLQHGLRDLPASRYPERVLSTPLGDYRLLARYDLLAVEPGERAVIADWKTSRKRPKRKYLAGRLQTRVYPYVLVRAGAHLNGGQPLEPAQVEMVYWFAAYPDDPARFVYSVARYEEDEAYLGALVAEIARTAEGEFPLTTRERACKFCLYRSLCERGERAGSLEELEGEGDEVEPEAEFDLDLDFEQIAEIVY